MVNDIYVIYICLVRCVFKKGNIEFNIRKFFICFIFILIIILVEVIWVVLKNFDGDIWFFVDILGGKFKFIFVGSRLFMVKFLFLIIIILLGDNFGIKLLFCIICLLDVFFFYNFDINDIILFGVIFMSILKVLWCLYLDYVNYWDIREDGFSIKNLV